MAYISSTTKGELDSSATITVPLTALSYTTDDYIVICVAGETTPGVLVTAPSGWTQIGYYSGTSVLAASYWIKATSSSITNPSIVVTNTTASNYIAFVVKDADATTFLNASSFVNETTSDKIFTAPTITTTNNNCLVVRCAMSGTTVGGLLQADGLKEIVVEEAFQGNFASALVVTKSMKYTAGATGTLEFNKIDSARGAVFTLGINNKVGGKLDAHLKTPPNYIACITDIADYAFRDLTADIATIGATSTASYDTITEGIATAFPGYGMYRATISRTSAPISWMGVMVDFVGTKNLTGKTLLFRIARSSLNNTDITEGVCFGLQSSVGNWSLWRARVIKAGLSDADYVCSFPVTETPTYTAGTLNLASVATFFICEKRIAVANISSQTITIQEMMVLDTLPTFVGGNSASPMTPAIISDALIDTARDLASLQGTGQNRWYLPVQIGDGTIETYFDATANSIEYKVPNNKYNPPENSIDLVFYPSATDTIKLSNCIIGTTRKQDFIFNQSGSASATIDVSGLTTFGFVYELLGGVSYIGANFIGGYGVLGHDGLFDNCVFKGCLATTAALELHDTGEAKNSVFTKGSETYAIELSEAGSYDLAGNTYTGYTKPLYISATTGTVTITLNIDDVEPTYDTDGATVVFDQPILDTTWTNADLANGSTILVRNIDTSTTIDFVASLATGTGYTITLTPSVDYTVGDVIEIWQTRKNGTTYYEERTSRIITTSGGGDIVEADALALCPICNAFGLDGGDSSITSKYTMDLVDDEMDIDVGGAWQVAELMVYWKYEMTQQTSMETFWGAWSILEDGSFRNNVDILSSVIDNTSATDAIESTGRRIYRSDGARPIKSPTTGIGALDFSWREPVTVVATGSGVLPADIVSIADAVWDETLSGHLTAGSTGEALDNAGGSTLTAADVWTYGTRELTASLDPTASTIASQVRTELTTELGRIDASISSRLASASYTAPLDSTATQTAVSNALTAYDPPTKAELDTAETNIIAAMPSEPDNASITAILADTNELQTNQGNWLTATGFATPTDVTNSQTAIIAEIDAIPTNPLLTNDARLNNIDATISSRLASADYIAPVDVSSDVTAIKNKTDNLPTDPATETTALKAVAKASLAAALSA